MARTLLAGGLLIAIAVAALGLRNRAQTLRAFTQAADEPTFTGARTCGRCHPAEFKAWSESPHGRHATARADPQGGAHLAIGSQWMQAYMRRGVDGFHRILPQCYDLNAGRWRPVDDVLRAIRGPPEPGHADGDQALDTRSRSFEVDCSGCHASGTRLRQRFGRMEGRWRDSAIDCESCHGPGRAHAEAWARLDDSEPMARIERLSPVAQTGVCARCHGGPPAVGTYTPEDAEHYIARGRILTGFFSSGAASGQSYQSRAFRRSPCHTVGGLACSDCHAPHDSKLRSPGHVDAMCTRCHGEQAGRAHTHHDLRREGARCVSCHMPRLLDGLMKDKRDHRIGSPLPHTGDAPDACTACHADRDKAWASHWYETWWGPPPIDDIDAIHGIHLARSGKREPAQPLLEAALRHDDPFFRWAALTLLGRPEHGIGDPSPEVRLAALDRAESDGLIDVLLSLRSDSHPVVRALAYGALVRHDQPSGPPPVDDLRIAVRQSRDLVTIRTELAAEWLQEDRDREVVPLLETTAALGRSGTRLPLLLAAAYHALGRGDDARRALNLTGSLGQQFTTEVRKMVARLLARGRSRVARKVLDAGLLHASSPMDRRALVQMARRLEQLPGRVVR